MLEPRVRAASAGTSARTSSSDPPTHQARSEPRLTSPWSPSGQVEPASRERVARFDRSPRRGGVGKGSGVTAHAPHRPEGLMDDTETEPREATKATDEDEEL